MTKSCRIQFYLAAVTPQNCLWLRKEIQNFKGVTRVYPKVSGLAMWSEIYKWYSFLPLSAVVLLFCESV